MCFGGGKKKVKTAEEIYQEKKPDYGPLPSLSMGDPVQKNKMLTDVPQMRTSGMQARSLLKVNYQEIIMPQGKGTYGSQVGRPKKKTMLKGKQKSLPPALKRKILKAKMKDG